MTALDVINDAKRVFGRSTAMAVGAATQGGAVRGAVGQAMSSAWKANRNQILTHAAYGAGGSVALGMGSAAFNGRGYSGGDFVRQAALGAAIGGGGTFAFHATRMPNMGTFNTLQSFRRGVTTSRGDLWVQRAMRMGR